MYQAGWGKTDIQLTADGYAMHGFGQWHQRARGQQSALLARAILVQDAPSQPPLIFCCMDLGYITRAMRAELVARLQSSLPHFGAERLVLTATHTHSGPGGCTQDGLYNIVTPGFVPQHVDAIVEAASHAIEAAGASLRPVDISLHQGRFDDATEVAWNRSLRAYNRNPDVTHRAPTETHLALDRSMQVIRVAQQGTTQALISLFGVHATCCGNSLNNYAADNKGEAACQTEDALQKAGATHPVAIFAQATAGDVSPFYHGPGDRARRAAIKQDAHYAYARANGQRQSQQALAIAAGDGDGTPLNGAVDGVLTYIDFTDITAAPAFADGASDAHTSPPCHGVAFFTGTRIDGPGMPQWLGQGARLMARRLKKKRLARLHKMPPAERRYYQRLYAAQGSKDILLESGPRKRLLGRQLTQLPLPDGIDPMVRELKRQARIGALDQSALVPSVLPLQLIRLGSLVLVCAPGEFTTTAGKRLVDCIQQTLRTPNDRVLISTYCNDYMGYVTTREEYQQRHYEAGHTIFGQWTLAAFQTCFARLAGELLRPPHQRRHDRTTRPQPPPADELAKRSRLTPPPQG